MRMYVLTGTKHVDWSGSKQTDIDTWTMIKLESKVNINVVMYMQKQEITTSTQLVGLWSTRTPRTESTSWESFYRVMVSFEEEGIIHVLCV